MVADGGCVSGDEELSGGDESSGAPTMPSTVTMRVRSTLRLRCHLQSSASGQYDVTWHKDDQRLTESTQKYLFTSDSPDGATSSVTISNTGQSVSQSVGLAVTLSDFTEPFHFTGAEVIGLFLDMSQPPLPKE